MLSLNLIISTVLLLLRLARLSVTSTRRILKVQYIPFHGSPPSRLGSWVPMIVPSPGREERSELPPCHRKNGRRYQPKSFKFKEVFWIPVSHSDNVTGHASVVERKSGREGRKGDCFQSQKEQSDFDGLISESGVRNLVKLRAYHKHRVVNSTLAQTVRQSWHFTGLYRSHSVRPNWINFMTFRTGMLLILSAY